jgi:glycosyltransferase involved in cell wall biosynthesis
MRHSWHSGSHQAEKGVVSVVVVCFNQAHFLPEAIESALNQTFLKTEILVVDDGSSDNTSQVASRYDQVRYLRQQNQGLAAARNAGLRNTNGEFVVFVDADDRLAPEALAIGVGALCAEPDCAFVAGRASLVDFTGAPLENDLPSPDNRECYIQLLEGNFIANTASVMFRRSVFSAVGGFATERHVEACGDYELYLRIARAHRALLHGGRVAEYRRYSTAMSNDFGRMLRAAVTTLRRERAHLKGNGHRRRALQKGLRNWRACYGWLLLEQALSNLSGRRTIVKGCRQLLTILTYAPLLAADGRRSSHAQRSR